MKSTSGGVILRGEHCTKALSALQSAVALSSGEAELSARTHIIVPMNCVFTVATEIWCVCGKSWAVILQ